MTKASERQPHPTTGDKDVVDQAVKDMLERKAFGERKYGTALMTHNGRDPLWDAYQEALDLAVYLCQVLMEREQE